MTSTPVEIGTLIAVVLKAKNLPNKRHIGKQDPYCCLTLNGEKRRTKAIKRGGQHPEWDEELRFTLWEDVEDELARTANGTDTPPPPPPKDGKKPKNMRIKGGKIMTVSCYADDPKEPDLIGDTTVDLSEVLTKGETDEWFTLMNKDKYCGEVYLELTFWSNEKPPEKKPAKAVQSNQYGGPGSFVPSDGRAGSLPPPGSIPSSLRASSSLAQLDLYIPPYEKITSPHERRHISAIDQITDEFGGLGLAGSRRRESFPPVHANHTHPPSDPGFSTIHSLPSNYTQSYDQSDYTDTPSYLYDRPTTPTQRSTYRHTSISGPHPYTDYQSHYPPRLDASQSYESNYSPTRGPMSSNGRGSLPPVPSGFMSIPTPAPSGFVPIPSSTPAPGAYGGYAPPVSHTPAPATYPPTSHTPAPSGFLPPSSAMGFHPSLPPQSYQYTGYPAPPASAPPQQYAAAPGVPPVAPPPSQSAPPQAFHAGGQPPPPPPVGLQQQQYPAYAPSTPSPPQPPQQQQQYNSPVHTPGSRPLPYPGQQQQQQYSNTTNGFSAGGHSPPGSVIFPNSSSYTTNPPPPPPPLIQNQPQQYQTNGYLPNPPPPPPLLHNPGAPPPPPPPPQQQSSGRPSLPTPPGPPGNLQPRQPSSNFQAIPPPPPPPSVVQQHQQQQQQQVHQSPQRNPLPQPPPFNQGNGQAYYPGPPPRPPAQSAQW